MSSSFYPIASIARLNVTLIDRTIADEFEDGSTSARQLWPAKTFKRRFGVQHAPLTLSEFDALKSFFIARGGRYDSFYFRDNHHRGGQALVRLAKPFPISRGGSQVYSVDLDFDEVAPVRALPDLDEVTTAAGVAPIFWLDTNRQIAYKHLGSWCGEDGIYDSVSCRWWDVTKNYPGVFIFGDPVLRADLATQYGATNGIGYSAASVPAFAYSKPALTIFTIVKHKTISAKQVILALGGSTSGSGLGLAITAAGNYEPFIHGSHTWTGVANSPNQTYRSVAVTWPQSSDAATLYVNGSATSAGSNTRSFTTGPIYIGRDAANGNVADLDNTWLAHALVIPRECSVAEIKAIHNLLAYQYALATV
jgi:hypothetical protein